MHGWLTKNRLLPYNPDQALQKGLRDGCKTCIITPEGRHDVPPLTSGEGMLIGDLDMRLITQAQTDDGFGWPLCKTGAFTSWFMTRARAGARADTRQLSRERRQRELH